MLFVSVLWSMYIAFQCKKKLFVQPKTEMRNDQKINFWHLILAFYRKSMYCRSAVYVTTCTILQALYLHRIDIQRRYFSAGTIIHGFKYIPILFEWRKKIMTTVWFDKRIFITFFCFSSASCSTLYKHISNCSYTCIPLPIKIVLSTAQNNVFQVAQANSIEIKQKRNYIWCMCKRRACVPKLAEALFCVRNQGHKHVV